MDGHSLQSLIRRILLSVFVLAAFAGTGGFYLLLHDQAMRQAEDDARILLGSTLAIREYTDSRITALLAQIPGGAFHEEMVPSFAAQTIFRSIKGMANSYSYHEAVLNPTNPHDRATPFEVGLIRRFRDEQDLPELSGVADTGEGQVFYLARPVRITDMGCLTCHSAPDRAPAAMLAKYGRENGFGWSMGETVGTQVLTVPVAQQLRGTLILVGLLTGGLCLLFGICYFALSFSLDAMVLRPLRLLGHAADTASRSSVSDAHVPRSGIGEVYRLAGAIERMRLSMTKALSELHRGSGDGGSSS